MINRPPTRIEVKLEDDLADYEESLEIRKKNSKISNNNKIQATFNSSSPAEIFAQNKNLKFNFSDSEKPCRNFNLEFSSGAMKSPNPNNSNKHFNITAKQNIISEFISEEGNEEVIEDEVQVQNFNFGSITPHSN